MVMDPTQWLVFRNTTNIQAFVVGRSPPREQLASQDVTCNVSHQAYIGNPLGSLPYKFRPNNTSHESKSVLCTLPLLLKSAQPVALSWRFGGRIPHTAPLLGPLTSLQSTLYVMSILLLTGKNALMIDSREAALGISRCR